MVMRRHCRACGHITSADPCHLCGEPRSVDVGERCQRSGDPAGHVRTVREVKAVSDGRTRALTAHTVDGSRCVQWVDIDRLEPLNHAQPELFSDHPRVSDRSEP